MNSKSPIVIMFSLLIATGCSQNKAQWTAEHITTISGLNVPECTLYYEATESTYVTNIESKPDEYWSPPRRISGWTRKTTSFTSRNLWTTRYRYIN